MQSSAYAVLIFLLLTLGASGQNLVPNPSFENYSNCPTAQSQFSLAIPWIQPAGAIVTPDYFNVCATQGTACGNVGIPSNLGGNNANAFDGVGYMGVINYYTSCPNCREYVGVALTSTLTAGQTYWLRMRVRLSSYSTYAANNMGMYIGPSIPNQNVNQPITSVVPQINSAAVINNKNGWTLVSGQYTAVGNEQYILIGNFYDNAATTIQNLGPSGGSCALATNGAYFYIDSVGVELFNPPPLMVSNDTTICLGDSITLTARGDPPYQWEDASNPGVTLSTDSNFVVFPTVNTMYKVYSNSYSDSVTVSLAYPPAVSLGNDTTICAPASIAINSTSTGASSYLWSTSDTTPYLSVGNTGQYILSVFNFCGSASDTIDIQVNNPTVDAGPDHNICPGTGTQLQAPGNWTSILWSPGIGLSATNIANPIATPGSSTTYIVIVQDSAGCTATDTVAINLTNTAPVVDLGVDTVVCDGQPILLDAGNPGATFLWSTSETANTIMAASSGAYSVVVTNNCGNDEDTIDVIISNITVDAGPDKQICQGDTTLITATGTFGSIIWSPSAFLSAPGMAQVRAFPNQSMNFIAQVSDTFGCSAMDSVYIRVHSMPIISAQLTQTILAGESVTLTASGANLWQWTPDNGTGNQQSSYQVTPDITTTFTAYGTDSAGCSGSDTVTITVLVSAAGSMPTAFSPNGDGVNDLFKVVWHAMPVEYSMKIFNRWGNLVFESTDPVEGWDGTYKGEDQGIDSYIYLLDYIGADGNEKFFKGNLTLIR